MHVRVWCLYVFFFYIFCFAHFRVSVVVVYITHSITKSKFDFVQYFVYDQNVAKHITFPSAQPVLSI